MSYNPWSFSSYKMSHEDHHQQKKEGRGKNDLIIALRASKAE